MLLNLMARSHDRVTRLTQAMQDHNRDADRDAYEVPQPAAASWHCSRLLAWEPAINLRGPPEAAASLQPARCFCYTLQYDR
jgi:hypothetical protein